MFFFWKNTERFREDLVIRKVIASLKTNLYIMFSEDSEDIS